MPAYLNIFYRPGLIKMSLKKKDNKAIWIFLRDNLGILIKDVDQPALYIEIFYHI